MKTKRLQKTLLIGLFLLATLTFSNLSMAQRIDWNSVDITKEHKRNGKISGAVAKSLKNAPTFITDYKVTKYVEQKGSNAKGGGAAIFAHAGLVGVEEQAFQQMIDDLYSHLKGELESAGITIANGEMLVKSETAIDNATGNKEFAGIHPGGATPDKTTYGDGVEIFRPRAPQYFKDGNAGLFYHKLASKEEVNLVSVQYFIQFAGFEQARGYNSKSLKTVPQIMITPIITISTPKGLYSVVTYGKAFFGNNDWSLGVLEASSRDGSWLGISSSADYAIKANQDAYLKEVSDILKAVQSNTVQLLKEELL